MSELDLEATPKRVTVTLPDAAAFPVGTFVKVDEDGWEIIKPDDGAKDWEPVMTELDLDAIRASLGFLKAEDLRAVATALIAEVEGLRAENREHREAWAELEESNP